MKIITDDKVSGTITSDGGTLSADFPTSNMTNNFPGRKWISNQCYDRLSVPVTSSTSALYIGNVTADTVSLRFLSDAVTVTGLTQADPGVVTAASHGFDDGDTVYFRDVGGMIEVNNSTYVVANSTTNTFELTDSSGNDVDTSGFTAYSSGGSVYKQHDSSTITLREVRNYTEFMQGITKVHKQGWADLSYSAESGIVQIEMYATLDKSSTITSWNSGSGDQDGELTDGASAVSLDENINVDVGSIVLFDESTSTDVRTIGRDGGSNNIKLTTASAHGLLDGDKIFIDNIQVSGTGIEINSMVFAVTNKTSTTVDLASTSTVFVTEASSATDLGAISKVHQITRILGNGTASDSVRLSPDPATHSGISTSATVNKILFGISCGVLRTGYSMTFPNAQAGYNDNTRSFSVREQIANGKMYQRNRNISRTPSGSIKLTAAEYNRFMDYAVDNDSKPFACLLFDDLGTTSRSAGFFIFSQLPNGVYDSRQLRQINFQFTEFI